VQSNSLVALASLPVAAPGNLLVAADVKVILLVIFIDQYFRNLRNDHFELKFKTPRES
jgi:hypothetical protein